MDNLLYVIIDALKFISEDKKRDVLMFIKGLRASEEVNQFSVDEVTK